MTVLRSDELAPPGRTDNVFLDTMVAVVFSRHRHARSELTHRREHAIQGRVTLVQSAFHPRLQHAVAIFGGEEQ